MAKVYVGARPKGRPGGSVVADYVAEEHADSVSKVTCTQAAGTQRAEDKGREPHVTRVRHLDDR